MALQKGSPAPDFKLKRKTADGLEEISLYEQIKKSKVVVLFFPMAFTGGCEKEMCMVSDGLSELESLAAAVLAISVNSPFTQEVFAQKAGIKVPLLSDFNREAAKAYDVLYETFLPGKLDFKDVAKRSAFVVDQAGTIVYSWSTDDPSVMPDLDEIKAALQG
ncbi:MAG: redoxin domain-containing protein [Opitutales bacterium]|nr:redoxin domain-containing protein [Opitutales bacterium]